MEKKVKVVNTKMCDIKNAERFFERTGKEAQQTYKYFIDENIDKMNSNGVQNVFLYIPFSDNDMYTMYFN